MSCSWYVRKAHAICVSQLAQALQLSFWACCARARWSRTCKVCSTANERGTVAVSVPHRALELAWARGWAAK